MSHPRFVVARRIQELGGRLALIVRKALVMVSAGTAIALSSVWVLGRLIEAQLFGVRAVDGTTFDREPLVGTRRAPSRDASRMARHVGESDRGIAIRMTAERAMGINTVSFHLKNIYEKLQVYSLKDSEPELACGARARRLRLMGRVGAVGRRHAPSLPTA